MIIPALALALAARQPSVIEPAPVPAAVPARAVQFLSNLVSRSDYPAEAARLRQQGLVRYELTIGTDGIPLSCRVLSSSGSPSLDEATCRVMRTRARFIPARDAAGRRTIDRVRHSINWVWPED